MTPEGKALQDKVLRALILLADDIHTKLELLKGDLAVLERAGVIVRPPSEELLKEADDATG